MNGIARAADTEGGSSHDSTVKLVQLPVCVGVSANRPPRAKCGYRNGERGTRQRVHACRRCVGVRQMDGVRRPRWHHGRAQQMPWEARWRAPTRRRWRSLSSTPASLLPSTTTYREDEWNRICRPLQASFDPRVSCSTQPSGNTHNSKCLAQRRLVRSMSRIKPDLTPPFKARSRPASPIRSMSPLRLL